MQPALVEMAKGFYRDEINDYLTYQELVGENQKTDFDADMERIALMERHHADFWKAMLEAQKEPLPVVRVNRLCGSTGCGCGFCVCCVSLSIPCCWLACWS